ncbi:hypothetical protein PhaeoP88_04673 (plasmid) [Phaeobacter inhibens]|uniref:Uncharacterized protein n=1 Tax=Phaeobacter inhibens TaxID=221822 RepID=A0A2I7KHB4_9RHOB|nr:hypothetical protein PhaeoP88_04673 [Phaeobacter inhibens]
MKLHKSPEPLAFGVGVSKTLGGFWVQIGPWLIVV